MPWDADIKVKNGRVFIELTDKSNGKVYKVEGSQSKPMSEYKSELRDLVLIDREEVEKGNKRKAEADFANFDAYLKEKTG